MTKSGSALSVAGNSFEQTIGLVTAGTEIMVGQPAKVGRGLRTIAINIAKLAKEESELEIANGKYSISLQNQQGEMLSTYEIMSQLAEVWGELGETEQTALGTALAGKTQFEVFSNVMKNWGNAVKATTTAQDAQGSSLRENARYLDSIEGHLQNFQSAWQQLSYHLMDSNTIKNVIDIGTGIVNVIDKIVSALDKLPGPLGAIVGFVGIISTILAGKKLWIIAQGFVGITQAAGATAQAVGTVATATSGIASAGSATGGIAGLTSAFGALSAVAAPLAITLAAVAAGIAMAKYDYSQSFDGKIDKYRELKDEIAKCSDELDILNQKEGELTSQEAAHKAVLETQLKLLEKKAELAKKEAQAKYEEEVKRKAESAEKTGNKSFYTSFNASEQDLSAAQRLNEIHARRLQIDKDIQRVSHTRVETEEQLESKTQKLEELEKENLRLIGLENELLGDVEEKFEKISEFDYSDLDDLAKLDYDNTFATIQKALTDVPEVADAIDNIIDKFGSVQFQEWGIDVTSLQSADDLATHIKEKIEAMGDEETVTFRMKSDDGTFKEVVKKKAEITEEDIDTIVHFKAENIEQVKKDKSEVSKPSTSEIEIVQQGLSDFMAGKNMAMTPGVAPITFDGKGTLKEINSNKKETVKSETGFINFRSNIGNITSKIQEAINQKRRLAGEQQFATGKQKGEKGGLSWLGDEGSRSNPKPELVVSSDGNAYLAGTTGWEIYPVKDSDTVYTYAQTKKLLGGKQIISGVAGELPRFKKGKKSKKPTNTNVKKANTKAKKTKKKSDKKQAEKLKKQREKKRNEFDKKLERLQHKAKVKHWTDEKYQKEYKKLYKKYKNYLSTDQSDDYTESREDYENERDTKAFQKQAENILNGQDLANFINDVTINDNLSDDEKAELIQDAGNSFATSEFNRRIGVIGRGESAGNIVSDIYNNQYLNAKEKQEMAAEAYKTAVEYNLQEYKNGKDTRKQILADIENYYKTRGQYDETYYQMLDQLREADREKEIKRLQSLQEVQDNSLSLAQKYIQRELNLVQKQINKTEEEADQLERLVELEKELTSAKSKKIRIF